jgi:hypothetical protein
MAHLPAVLNTISSQAAVLRAARRSEIRLDGEIGAIRDRLTELSAELAALSAQLDGLAAPRAEAAPGATRAVLRGDAPGEQPAIPLPRAVPAAAPAAGVHLRIDTDVAVPDRLNGAGA